jgi:23S rRNA (cytosine1962-C5)-methyltransferase
LTETIEQQLARAIERRAALGLPSADTDAYRLIHGEGDGVEALTVDVYGQHLVASLYTESYGERERAWIDELGALGYDGVYLKRRPRQANEVGDRERRERAPQHAAVGNDAADAIVVHERGVPFEVRLGDGFSTGLFLDQRENRARLAELAAGKSVLNLFAYTCAFGVVAAAAGATRTVNVDVAKGVLERGRINYALSGLRDGDHTFLARDVLETVPKLVKRGERFDIVVLDPPSYASTKQGRFSVERDYPMLLEIALSAVAEGGTLLACTNHHKLADDDLARAIRTAQTAVKRSIRRLDLAAPPADHPTAAGRVPHLKSAWMTL